MESTITSVVSNLDLKVLIEYDQDYQIYVARCLDTGAVATGETPEEASKLMKETLELDILLAIRANNLDNLFHVTATPDVKSRWYETIAANPESMESISLNIQQDSPAKRGPRSARIEARIRRSA